MGNPVDMSIELAGVRLQNPVMPASGTFGYGQEYKDVFDLNKLGALVTKSITKEPRYGNELPRIAECTSGMLNSIGLQNPGLEHFREVDLPEIRKIYRGPIVANISGFSVDEYRGLPRRWTGKSRWRFWKSISAVRMWITAVPPSVRIRSCRKRLHGRFGT